MSAFEGPQLLERRWVHLLSLGAALGLAPLASCAPEGVSEPRVSPEPLSLTERCATATL